MLQNSTVQFRQFIEEILEEIDVPESRYEQAVDRYHSVGDWLQRHGSAVGRFSPELYSQGSFRLGTVIKPPIEEDYDIDLVCQLDLTKSNVTQKQLKN